MAVNPTPAAGGIGGLLGGAIAGSGGDPTGGTGSYNYTPLSGGISKPWANAEKTYQDSAWGGTGAYKTALNNGVASESNLMGPSDDDTPANQALNARSNQIYQGNVNQIASRATPMAQEATTQLQTNDMNHQAAIYSNEQSQAQINFKNASFQRAAAIQMANLKNGLYNQLFGGVAQTAGAGMAMIAAPSTQSGGSGSNLTAPPISYNDGSSSPSLGLNYSSGNWWDQPDTGATGDYSSASGSLG